MGRISDRQQQVILNYKANGGNMKQAMIEAGYSETYADRNSKYLLGLIGEEIKTQQKDIISSKIKTVTEIQEWWSSKLDNPIIELKDQIKCSELLAKSQGAFVDRVELDADMDLKVVVDYGE